MSKMELTTTSEGVPQGLVTTIQLWADARTDASSARRRDLIRNKISALGAFFGDGNPAMSQHPGQRPGRCERSDGRHHSTRKLFAATCGGG
jgi:hypothetical protein